MIIVAAIVWVAMWTVTGYFTVRTIQMQIENRRIAKQLIEINKLCDEVERALERGL